VPGSASYWVIAMRPEDESHSEQELLGRVAARLREPVPLSDRVEREVLARIQAERRNGGTVTGVRRTRRPVVALALAAGIAAIFASGVLVGRRSMGGTAASVELRSVEFVLRTTADSAVAVVGDFNDWDPHATPLRSGSDSLWSVVVPLRPGRYRYTFVVDGTQWRRDPSAPRALEDDFGTPTSVITVSQR
jgi:Glycogen recognition site of AMP-activated protein kinase